MIGAVTGMGADRRGDRRGRRRCGRGHDTSALLAERGAMPGGLCAAGHRRKACLARTQLAMLAHPGRHAGHCRLPDLEQLDHLVGVDVPVFDMLDVTATSATSGSVRRPETRPAATGVPQRLLPGDVLDETGTPATET